MVFHTCLSCSGRVRKDVLREVCTTTISRIANYLAAPILFFIICGCNHRQVMEKQDFDLTSNAASINSHVFPFAFFLICLFHSNASALSYSALNNHTHACTNTYTHTRTNTCFRLLSNLLFYFSATRRGSSPTTTVTKTTATTANQRWAFRIS